MKENKKALLVDVNLKVRVIVDESVDPDVDPEFEEAVQEAVRHRMSEEGISFIASGIDNYDDDKINPFDPDFDV